MNFLSSLKIAIHADITNTFDVAEALTKPYIAGFTTNPTLARKGGVRNYEVFGRTLATMTDRPVSFEVIADEFMEMGAQAVKISSWGKNIYVKIPITNSRGESSLALVSELADRGIKVNVTAITSLRQVIQLTHAVDYRSDLIVSVFAGRIADAGFDPRLILKMCATELGYMHANAKLLWASTREVYNIVEAEAADCGIITVPPDIMAKAERTLGGDLTKVSLETVKMFAKDAKEAAFSL